MSHNKIRDTYGNSAASGFSVDFFRHAAIGGRDAFLACPFVSTYEPIEFLTRGGCQVNLLVRLCSITPPVILRKALNDPLVAVRYYTDRAFHAKLYIVGDIAMVGSANLTNAGLMSNREVSVVLRQERDEGFDELPGIFRMFWDHADVFTPELCTQYEEAFKLVGKPTEDANFQAHIEKFVPAAIPPSATVGSDAVSKKRSFLQSLRRKYDEQLGPAFEEVRQVFNQDGRRRAEFIGGDLDIEIGRFLGWLRIVHAPGDTWRASPLANAAERKLRLNRWMDRWFDQINTDAGDMVRAESEVGNIARLRQTLESTDSIKNATYDEIFDALTGAHAFNDRLRFVAGGLKGLRVEFFERNGLNAIKATLTYLLHGKGTQLERAYDCLYNEKLRLAGFGEACTMEVVGWMDLDRPPINGRTIKALRFLGFDVKD
ncbi:phospholipase D-like domain-containing protein [Parasphingorhabdus sp.]|uniref:phospholipase D family protein n=1 Tax=Parasphingorhabdus sp. TaxID=2709688 RepID=UPI003A8FC6B0